MKQKNNSQLALSIFACAVGMVMLAYASVPLYRLFCAATGFGGTTQRALHAPGAVSERTIEVRFNADIAPDLPWKFTPGQKAMRVKIGEQGLTYFVTKNLANKPITGRAAYNVLPDNTGKYFTKVQCFCFINQTLGAGQEVNMPVSFYIDPAFLNDPEMKDVSTITLSYTFFPTKKPEE
jgi:cytochrome c oxidase assembly protein subunit 11